MNKQMRLEMRALTNHSNKEVKNSEPKTMVITHRKKGMNIYENISVDTLCKVVSKGCARNQSFCKIFDHADQDG